MRAPGIRKWYPLDIAESFNLYWKDWRDIEVKVGDWIKSDDDYVAMVTKRIIARDSTGYIMYVVHTVLGGFSQKRKDPLLFKESAEILSTYSGFHKKIKKLTGREKVAADLIIDGASPDDAIRIAFPGVPENKRKAYFRTLIKKESIITYMASKLKEAFSIEGVDENYLASQIKGLIEESNDRIKLETIKLTLELQGYMGTKTERTTKTAKIEFDSSDIAILEEKHVDETKVEGLLTEGDDNDRE